MGGLFETDPETGARRTRAALPERIQTILSASAPPDEGVVTPSLDRRERLLPAPDTDADRPARPGSLGRLASILGSANDSSDSLFSVDKAADGRPLPLPPKPRPDKPQTISDAGLQFIKAKEDFKDKIYGSKKKTIGYGHLLLPGEAELYKNGIDEAAAEFLLRPDVAEAEKAMRRLVAVPLTQKQHDALVSFTFNIGQGELKKSKFLSLLNEGAYNAAAEELSEWKYVSVKRGGKDVKIISPWQVERREAERKMFLGLE